jgi:hypothetical protein
MTDPSPTRPTRNFADDFFASIRDIYTRPYRPTGHPSHDERARTPKELIGDIAWSYCGIIDSEDVPPETRVTLCVGDLDAALHAAFHAGCKYAESNR